jgi:putative hydrolase of the HAD superfamily
MLGPFSAVFLDVGGPLYPDENFLVAAHTALNEIRALDHKPPVENEELRETFDYVRNTEGVSLRKTLAKVFLGDVNLVSELHRRIAPHWRHPAGSLYRDVVPFLTATSEHCVLGIIANQEAHTKDALTRDKVSPFITSWGLSALVGWEKPSPEIFRWALADLGVRPENALHIGNRFDTDVLPAHELGLATAWILRGEAPDNPPAPQKATADFVVNNLVELVPMILPLLAGKEQ